MRMHEYMSKVCAFLLLCVCSVSLLQAQTERKIYNVCRSETPFVIGDSSFTESGDYDVVFSADSVLHMTLVVHENPTPHIDGNASRCPNSFTILWVSQNYSHYLWLNGDTTQSNLVWTNFTSVLVTDEHGCKGRDSITVTELTVPEISIVGADSVCYGNSVTLHLSGITSGYWKYEGVETGKVSTLTYTPSRNNHYVTNIIVNGFSTQGCIVKDTLRMHNHSIDTVYQGVQVCSNEYPYVIGPYQFDAPGNYVMHFTSSHGCDSVVFISIRTKPVPTANISGNTEFCPTSSTQLYASGSGSILWSTGENYSPINVSTPGPITLIITAANGCRAYDTVYVTQLPMPNVTITGPSVCCEGATVTLTASGADSYQWSTGATSASIMVSPTATTTYEVTGTSQCPATASFTVTWIPNPDLVVSGDHSFCSGTSTVLTASGAESYIWKNNYNIVLSTSDTVEIIAGGVYFVTGTNAPSCSSTSMEVVETKSLPTATILTDKPSQTMCSGDSMRLIAGWAEGYTYLWNTQETTNSITVKDGGVYTLTVTAANGCTSQASLYITEYDLPVITFSGDVSVCRGDTATLIASAPNAVSYTWSNYMTGSTIRVSPLEDTRYEVRVVDNHACASSSFTNLMVAEYPVVTITGRDSLCVGDSILLSSTGGFACIWNDEVTTPNRYVTQPGTYTVTHANIWGCTASASKNVWNYEMPVAEISGVPWFCSGNYTVLTAHGGESYKWNNGSTDSVIIVNNAGLFSVKLWDKHSCTATDTVDVFARVNPLVLIEGQRSVCEGDTAILTAKAPTAVNYLWNTQSRDSMISVSTPGLYSVIVTDSFSCHSQASINFKVNALPEAYIVGDSVVCQGVAAQLEAMGGISYLWSTDDTSKIIHVTPDTTTTYFLTVRDTNGCVNYAYYTVRVKPITPIYIEGPDGFCVRDSALLVAHGSDTYQWSTGKIGDSLYVKEPGLYVVSSAEINGCASSASKLMVEYQLPEVTIEGNEQSCIGDTVILRAVCSSPVTYFWSNGSTDSIAKVVSFNVYRVTVTDTNSCHNTAAKLVMFYTKPSVEIEAPTSVCRGDTVSLMALSADEVTYLWSTGQSGATINVSPNYNANYSVVVTNGYQCTSSASTSLVVYPKPYVAITGDTALCDGSFTTLVATAAQSYSWSTGETTQSIQVNQAGDYSVLITNGLGCTNRTAVHVNVYPIPQPVITGVDETCAGEHLCLAVHGGGTYLWSTGSTDSVIYVTPNTTTQYSVTASTTHCSATATHTVTVHARPVAQIQSESAMCEGNTLTLNALGGVSYIWSTGAITPSILINQGGSYWVRAQNEYGCADTARKTIIEHARPEVYIVGDSAFCEGSSIVLTAYCIGTCVWNTGDSLPTILVTQSGTYQVTVTSLYGCTATSSRNVITYAAPSVNIIGVAEMCKPDTVTLTADCENAASFHWNTGATTQTIEVSPMVTTNYSLTAISAEGCSAYSSHELAVHEPYAGNFVGETCIGTPYTGQGFNIPVQQEAGVFTYVQRLQTAYGCDSVRTLTLTVNDVPHIESEITGTSVLTAPGNYVYMIDAVPTAIVYEWVMSNTNWPLTFNETVAQISVASTGSGYLQVYAINGCGQSLPKSMLIVYDNGVEDFENTQIKIYPNPADQWLNIEIGNETLSGEVWIVDMSGKIVDKQYILGSSKIDVSDLAEGVYTLRFVDGTKTFYSKFIKKK